MIKTEPRLKELSIDDKGNIIETVSDFVNVLKKNVIENFLHN